MDNWREDRIRSCLRGENPTLLARMKSGFAVIADNQFLPGYCILLAYPKVVSLNALPLSERSQYLLDTTLIGDAITRVCAPSRINYSTLGNLDHYLHTHIEARYEWEPEPYRHKPSWTYPEETRYTAQYEYCEERHGDLKRKITETLLDLAEQSEYRKPK